MDQQVVVAAGRHRRPPHFPPARTGPAVQRGAQQPEYDAPASFGHAAMDRHWRSENSMASRSSGAVYAPRSIRTGSSAAGPDSVRLPREAGRTIPVAVLEPVEDA